MTTLQQLQARKRKAHQVEVGATGTAGAVGSVFGAAKLRDEYRRQSPEHAARFTRATTGVGLRAIKHGADPVKVSHLVSTVESKHPPFKALAAATAAAGVAGAARKYQGVQSIRARRREQERQGTSSLTKGSTMTMTVSAFGIDHAAPMSKALPANARERRDRRNRSIGGLTGGAAAGGALGAARGARLTPIGPNKAGRGIQRVAAGVLHGGRGAVAGGIAGTAGAVVAHERELKQKHGVSKSLSAADRKQRAKTGAIAGAALGGAAGHALGRAGGPSRGVLRILDQPASRTMRTRGRVGAVTGAVAGGAALRAHVKRKDSMAKSVSAFGIDHAG